ncbi:HD domain-containing protein [Staphylococcus equorum]|uniref:phosphohydrolase n=1 Tax=Staphylococcus equorum TaxID=246432 RepID=UPI002DBE476F|nr:phosphohydrolase [Staphylococcus equorum]MEB7848670.1 HD domain-containing protein [Staphylococcus equorum]MEB8108914.1 HD domain-containing protein [Staphylococcus equorum]MEB8174680.1 HD domain-containing protein [Staphylococcus equorum]
MLKDINEIVVPDSKIIQEAQEVVHEYGNELIWNHSNRVYLFGEVKGMQDNLKYDKELLYMCSLFHDLGLTNQYSSDDLRFEVDGANAVRQFLDIHNYNDQDLQLAWDSIALHTTIGVAEHKENNVALLYHGVGMDVMSDNWDQYSDEIRKAIVNKFPRGNFKKDVLTAFYEGFKHKPETTFGNIKSDVVKYFEPEYPQNNFCSCVLRSKWDD